MVGTGQRRARSESSFRSDIQGLRMIAVVAVVLNHMFAWPRGGFVGVDVFFVISGFLITGLLLREHDRTGHISFKKFYIRRFKRIVPAATLTILVTVIIGFLVFTQQRALSTLRDGVLATFFVSNWGFAADGTDYFRQNGPLSPLQNFWSLSVEEQFYFVWPWLMLLAFTIVGRRAQLNSRLTRSTAGLLMAMIIIASFLWSLKESGGAPTVAYFSSLSRAWELGVGAMLAICAGAFAHLPDKARTILAYVGLAGILLSLFVTREDALFPAPGALLPVLATVCVIASGVGSQAQHVWILTNPVSQWIGNLSYSIYLWHFPVIVLVAVFVPSPSFIGHVAIVALVLSLSIASYYFVEDPIRRSAFLDPGVRRGKRRAAGPTRWFVAFVSLALFTFPLVVVVFAQANASAQATAAAVQPPAAGGDADSPAEAALFSELREAATATTWPELVPSVDEVGINEDLENCLNPESLGPEVCMFGDGEKTAVVVGDSFSMSWMPALRPVLQEQGYRVKGIAFSVCSVSSLHSELWMGEEGTKNCNSHKQAIIDSINDYNPGIVIIIDSEYSFIQTEPSTGDLEAAWTQGRADSLSQLVADGRRVIVVQQNPTGAEIHSCYSPVTPPSNCAEPPSEAFQRKAVTDQRAAEQTGAEFIPTVDWFTVDGMVLPYAGNAIQRWDLGHLSEPYTLKLIDPLRAKLFPTPDQ